VVRLVRTLEASSPGALILVGHDARNCRVTRDDLPPSPNVRLFHPPGRVERGRLSMLSPYFQAIDLLRERGTDYDWLVYLSGQDYPTQPLSFSEAFLAASRHDAYLRTWEAFAPQTPWGRPNQGRTRYGFQYHQAPAALAPVLRILRAFNGVQSLAHVHLVYGPLIGLRARRTPFGTGRTCYAGKQWLTVRRACVEYLDEQVRREPELLAYYARCICPDESLFQTLLVNAGRFRLVDDDLRYSDFAGSRDGRPRVLGEADFETITIPRYHFARKFDATHDERILDRLDTRIFEGARE
jgi:hypothetical protein